MTASAFVGAASAATANHDDTHRPIPSRRPMIQVETHWRGGRTTNRG